MQLPWIKLNTMTADEIAEFMREEGRRGRRCSSIACPLADADWRILAKTRVHIGAGFLHEIPLTDAQQQFAREFDAGAYPELIEEK
jgi:hypothetical protein